MIYSFDTDDDSEAIAALLVYAVYRSRDMKRFKVTPDMWAQIERFVKASAKRAERLTQFLESLKPRMSCGTLNPKWMETGIKGLLPITDSAGHVNYIESADSREFLTSILAIADHKKVLNVLYRETTLVILLVRQRLEVEKPIENKLQTQVLEADEL